MLVFRLLLTVVGSLGVGVIAVQPGARTGDSNTRKHRRSADDDCRHVAASFVRIIGHDMHDMPENKIYDNDLAVCQWTEVDRRKTCCTRLMERRLHQAAIDDTHDILTTTSGHLKNLLITNTDNYRDEFLKLLSLSENSTKSMLSWSYKIPANEANAYVEKLFQNLREVLLQEDDEIEDSITSFFDSLFASVFVYTISEAEGTLVPKDQASCFRTARKDLTPTPFSEVIQRLTHDLTRSLSIARSLLESFGLAAEVINATENFHLEHQCSRGLTRLLYCSYCDGHTDVRPCRNFCMNVAHGCLAQVTDLNSHWNLFVESVERLVQSMRGAFDLQDVMALVHSRISDSIMRTMETVHRYHSQLVSRCGALVRVSPGVSTSRRSMETSRKPTTHPPRLAEIRLHRKIGMFVKNLAVSHNFYQKLPDTLCSSEKMSAGNYDTCWNGTSLGAYTKPVPTQDFSTQVVENPEMRVPESRQSMILYLTEKLDNMTKVLHNSVIPKLPVMLSDERAHDSFDQSGDESQSSGDGSEVKTDTDGTDDTMDESGSSSGNDPDVPEVKKPQTGRKGGSKGVGGEEIVPHVTVTDFHFKELSTKASQVPYVTKSKSEEATIKVIQTSIGCTLSITHFHCLLTTVSVLTFMKSLW